MYFSRTALKGLGLCAAQLIQQGLCSPAQLFSNPNISIPEAPSANQFALTTNPHRNLFNSPSRQRFHHSLNHSHDGKGYETLGSLFSGVYPLINLTWLGKEPQNFVAYVDTGSADTWVISNDFQCIDPITRVLEPQAACDFGALYNPALGDFTNITSEAYYIQYFPEMTSLNGSMGYAPLTLGGLTVPKQEVALITEAAWAGAENVTSSLIGLSYSTGVGARYRSNGTQAIYDPIFMTMMKEGIVKEGVFTLAIDRVPQGTSASVPTGQMAFGGLVSPEFYYPPFTTVPIEELKLAPIGLAFYPTTHELLYSLKNGTIASGGVYQSIIDSGTSPNFIPSAAAAELNAQFSPPAVYNETLGYWTVDCDAKAPFAAYKIGGKVMPVDPQDMIVRSLNGLPGYEDICFSVFADGGDPSGDGFFIIGEVWQRSYVIAYDVRRSMLHFANRRPY